jgi:hypothetical protein
MSGNTEGLLAALRRHHRGLLRVGERVDAVRFVLDGAGRGPVLVATGDALDATDLVLHIPDDGDEGLHILGQPEALDPAVEEGCDRWQFYHGVQSTGRVRDAKFMRLRPESLRLAESVLDADDVDLSNPWRKDEPGLVKMLNRDAARLKRLCAAAAKVDVPTPVAVGIDPGGFDVRASVGVIRAEFPESVASVEAARAWIEQA